MEAFKECSYPDTVGRYNAPRFCPLFCFAQPRNMVREFAIKIARWTKMAHISIWQPSINGASASSSAKVGVLWLLHIWALGRYVSMIVSSTTMEQREYNGILEVTKVCRLQGNGCMHTNVLEFYRENCDFRTVLLPLCESTRYIRQCVLSVSSRRHFAWKSFSCQTSFALFEVVCQFARQRWHRRKPGYYARNIKIWYVLSW